MRIVVVDDEELVGLLLEHFLAQLGHTLIGRFVNPAEALPVIFETKPDLVITDYVMPGMNGLRLIDEVRMVCPLTQFILMSGYVKDAKIENTEWEQRFLSKPFTLDQLKQVLNF